MRDRVDGRLTGAFALVIASSVASLAATGCAVEGGGLDLGAEDDGGSVPSPPRDDARSPPHDDAYVHDSGGRGDAGPGRDSGAHDSGPGPGRDDAPASSDTGGPGADSAPPPPPPDDAGPTGGCYRETYHPTVALDDLVSAYSSAKWLETSLEVLARRYPSGHFILDTEKADPQLPGFAATGSFDALMESLMTMCHEETHGYDYEHAGAGDHAYTMGDGMIVHVPVGKTFPRSEVLALITDGSTSLYDDTYLKGSMGSYDFADMNDELNAYTNGLACLTTVQEHETSGISARDGSVAHILYLQLYLRIARASHPDVYSFLQGDPSWMKFVKYAWAREFFWDAQAKPYPSLSIGADAIWAHVNEAANLDEIRRFTGREPADVACHPEL